MGCDWLMVRFWIEVIFLPATVIASAITVAGGIITGPVFEFAGVGLVGLVVGFTGGAALTDEVPGVGCGELDGGGVAGGAVGLEAACMVIVPDPLMQPGEFGQVPW
jgi:hypothetical protein